MFFVLPVGMNYRTERLPLVTLTLIGLNTLVWLASLILALCTDGESSGWIVQNLWLIPAQSFWWTYLTSMFVHAGIFHLLGNMIFLFLFGACVEDIIGRVRFVVFYLTSGLVAELVYIALSPDHFLSTQPMGGASGAISGCMGMYLLLRAAADIEFKYFVWLFIYIRAGEFAIPAWVAITFWFVKDLFWTVLGLISPHPGGGVAFGAHVGGFLGGLALVIIYKRVTQQSKPADESAAPARKPSPIRVTLTHRTVATTAETPTIFLHDGAQQTGPFTLTQVQAMLRAGTISHEFQYWSEGLDDWQNVAELSG